MIMPDTPIIWYLVVYVVEYHPLTTYTYSSTGSAVGVAAGFGLIILGTESDGSVVQPRTDAALYGLKADLEMTDISGIRGVTCI